MGRDNTRIDYRERMDRVRDYIYDHLNDEIDLNKLAEVACLSPYHWHRVYRAMNGETIATTVKRLRLHRAAGYLAHTTLPIAEVAGKSGYPNLQSFNRIFKSVYGMPPAQYRKDGSHRKFQTLSQGKVGEMYDVTIKEIPKSEAVTVCHQGSYMQVGKAFDRLFGWLAEHELIAPDIRTIGIYYDDPSAVPEADLRARAGALLGKTCKVEAPVEKTVISGGRYAVLTHKGPYADMQAAYDWFFGEWLPQSGKEAANAPVFEEYLNNPRDTAPADLVTEIYMPLAS